MNDRRRTRRPGSLAAREQGSGVLSSTEARPAQTRGGPQELLATVDVEIEMLGQRTRALGTDPHARQELIDHIGRLEALMHELRQANANLTLASLDASSRETDAVESHRRQTLFLSMLAHELRNPLAPISTSVELLGKMTGLPPAVQTLQRILDRQTRHLTRLVDDLLDVSRINSNKLRICKEDILLSQCLEHAIETCQPELNARKQVLHLEAEVARLWVHADPTRLAQLFANLLLNASKFSAEGSPLFLSARQEGQQVHVSVRDQGIGIAPERQPHVFDLFTQGAVGEGMMAKGLGLGLTLAQTIAKLHQGSVRLKSPGVGQGSEFIVTLPILPHPPDHAAAPLSPAQSAMARPKRILLIDDHPDINQTLGELLKTEGHHVDCAVDGPSGLSLEEAGPYEVICCDIGLPGMNGHEVAKRLRARQSQARLIAISGYDQREQKELALAAGFDHYLVKPISGDELLALIAHG